MVSQSQPKFGVLYTIVKHLKTLHQNGGHDARYLADKNFQLLMSKSSPTLEQILDETNQLDVSAEISQVSIHYLYIIRYFF